MSLRKLSTHRGFAIFKASPWARRWMGPSTKIMKSVRAAIDSLSQARPATSLEYLQGLYLDKGYDFDEVRRTLDEFGFTARSRTKGARAIRQEASFKSRRWVAGLTHIWRNRFQRILVRWDKISRQLHRLYSFRLCTCCFQSHWAIAIGF